MHLHVFVKKLCYRSVRWRHNDYYAIIVVLNLPLRNIQYSLSTGAQTPSKPTPLFCQKSIVLLGNNILVIYYLM